MTDPVQFADVSARFGLPFLRAGQSQKEFFINEAFALSDFLHHTSVSGEASSPPSDPSDGDLWIVGFAASGSWAGKEGQLAGWYANSWHYIAPSNGMRIFDQAAGQIAVFSNGWQRAVPPAEVDGGTTIDVELRAAFAHLVEALGVAGIFPVTQ